jgi:hypothetical protein
MLHAEDITPGNAGRINGDYLGWKLLTTPPGARVQLLNPSGSEVGPGQVATWGKATANEVDAYGFPLNLSEFVAA